MPFLDLSVPQRNIIASRLDPKEKKRDRDGIEVSLEKGKEAGKTMKEARGKLFLIGFALRNFKILAGSVVKLHKKGITYTKLKNL